MAPAMDAELLARLEAHACMHDDLAMHDTEQAQWASDLREAVKRLRADLAAELDCRTCRHFRGTQHCHSVLRCVDGSGYQRGGVVQLWEAAPVSDEMDILAAYSRTDGRREWVSVGTWLRPGEVVAHMNDPRPNAQHQPRR